VALIVLHSPLFFYQCFLVPVDLERLPIQQRADPIFYPIRFLQASILSGHFATCPDGGKDLVPKRHHDCHGKTARDGSHLG